MMSPVSLRKRKVYLVAKHLYMYHRVKCPLACARVLKYKVRLNRKRGGFRRPLLGGCKCYSGSCQADPRNSGGYPESREKNRCYSPPSTRAPCSFAVD